MTNLKNRYSWIFVLILMAGVVIGGLYWWNQRQIEKPTSLQKISFATVPSMVEVPSHVAYHNKYFEDEGLDVNLVFTPSGNLSLERLLNGEFDFATVTGTPVVHKSFVRDDFYIIGDIVHPVEHQVLARKDKGIKSVVDLKGKKLAVMKGTSADFFMDFFLIYNGLNRSDVEIVNMLAPDMPSAITEGKVDAMFCWQPFILKARKELGENAIILPSENIHTVPWLIIVRKNYARENPEILEKFLSAIKRAEDFVKTNREDSISIHAEMSKVDRSTVDSLIDNMTYNLSLDHYLLINLENQARWAIRHKYTDKTEVPNFLEYIYFDALEKIKPAAVTAIKGSKK